jgi:hypothetical protein
VWCTIFLLVRHTLWQAEAEAPDISLVRLVPHAAPVPAMHAPAGSTRLRPASWTLQWGPPAALGPRRGCGPGLSGTDVTQWLFS